MMAPANLIFIQLDNHNRAVAGCSGYAIAYVQFSAAKID
jgi:hypothetical protein